MRLIESCSNQSHNVHLMFCVTFSLRSRLLDVSYDLVPITLSYLLNLLNLLDFALLAAQFPQFTFLTSVHDLGVTLYNTLSFSAHISNLSRSSSYHLRHLRAV